MSELKQIFEHKDLQPQLITVLLGTEILRIIQKPEADTMDISITVVEKKA